MNLSQWFYDQLQSSADGFVWSVEQVPIARRNIRPPKGLGEWTAMRHVFHLAFYEKTFAFPGMQQWLDNPPPISEGEDEDVAWGEGREDPESMLAEFKQARSEQVKLLSRFDDLAWNTTRETVWGPVTLVWVVSKTYQHTAEHTSDVLRIALFWDAAEKRAQANGS